MNKSSAFKLTTFYCITGLQLRWSETCPLAPIWLLQVACSRVVDQLLRAADAVRANPSANWDLQRCRLLRKGKTRWIPTNITLLSSSLVPGCLLHPCRSSSSSDGARGHLLSTWGAHVIHPLWRLDNLLEVSQLVAGTPTECFYSFPKMLGAGSFYKVVGQ